MHYGHAELNQIRHEHDLGPTLAAEALKAGCPTLAGTIAQTLRDTATDRFSDDTQFLKFHGIYQQDDRALRKTGKKYIFMVRLRLPCGVMTPAQYLTCDDLATRYGNCPISGVDAGGQSPGDHSRLLRQRHVRGRADRQGARGTASARPRQEHPHDPLVRQRLAPGRPRRWSKPTNFETSARITLMISVPGIPKNWKTDALVELVDIYPSLCELCRLNPPDYLEGTSFAPLIESPDRPWKTDAFTCLTDYTTRSIRTDRYRFIQRASGQDELYDCRDDPAENRNLARDPASQQVLQQVQAALRAGWRRAKPVPASD